jgi:pimeloyl-ACP methyl ester carboxylesterase
MWGRNHSELDDFGLKANCVLLDKLLLRKLHFMKLSSLVSSVALAACLMACAENTSSPEVINVDEVKTATVTDNAVATAPLADIPIKSGALAGLYKNAGDNTPVVLIVPGSGPTDLNGNNMAGLNAGTLKLLAEGLGAKGISTVRVDKRGMYSSIGAGDGNAVTVEIYARDYRDWVDTIKTETSTECVYLLGHSEGALMVSAAAVNNSDVCGLVLVSGVGRSFGDVLRAQLKANPANMIVMKDAMAAIDSLERGETIVVDDFHPALKGMFHPAIQNYLISLMQTDPAIVAKEANVKTLVVQGETDIQTSVEDAKLLADATQGKLVVVEGVNHVLKKSTKNRIATMQNYANPDMPISQEVVDEIAGFIFE